MNLRQARRHGITFRSMLKAARRCGPDCKPEDLMGELVNSGDIRDGEGIDWDQLLDLIEKWLPLILKIISIF